ncbi:MAG: nucleotidyl transferase AbiEii/AbiGii toxin family protein [Lysobacteraceae bacterium]
MATIPPARLRQILDDVTRALTRKNIRHALAGGMALAAHGIPRATKDLDFLIDAADEQAADRALDELGFNREIRGQGFARYVRRPLKELPEIAEWVDLLYARRELGRQLLGEAQKVPIARDDGPPLAVVPVDGLILMKLMAMVADPSRVQDRQDILDLLQHHGADLHHTWIATEAATLGTAYEHLWQQLLNAHQRGPSSPGPIEGL